MIDEGLIIMAVGMPAVFAFLTVMVLTMRFMSGFIIRNFPDSEESPRGGPKTAGASEAAGRAARWDEADEAEIAAAVAGAFASAGAEEAEIAAAAAAARMYC